jgi:sensor histidine kinase YesM
MKIKFDKRVEVVFVVVALLGIAGREWVIPQITWPLQLLLFSLSLVMLNSVWAFHYWFNAWLNRWLPFERDVNKRVAVQLLGGWGIVKTVLIGIGLFLINHLVPELSQSMNRLNIVALGAGAFLANIVLGLGFIANHFFIQWQANLVRAARLEKEKAQVQYDNLANQLNPHFLFNSLSSLDSLIDENPALARRFLQQLSKVFRYVLQHKDNELVTLETELDFIKNYVSLLKTRFDGTFQLSYQISPDGHDRQIVPVTLQILIENAIKHNVISEANPLTVHITADADCLIVSNPIQRKRQVGTSNGQGLQNLAMLYSYLSKNPVVVQDNNETFQVQIPLLTGS